MMLRAPPSYSSSGYPLSIRVLADLRKFSNEDLKIFQEELKGSVEQRIEVTSQLGPDKAHGQRQAAEQSLIIQIDKIINDRDPQ